MSAPRPPRMNQAAGFRDPAPNLPRVLSGQLVFALLACLLLCCGMPSLAQAEKLSLDRGWLFHQGDIPFPEIQGHDATYQSTKAGRAPGAAALDYDDSLWRQLDLPHDWVSEAGFDPSANISQGYRPRGVAWYRRHFFLPESDRAKHLELQFDGIATHCTVWVNGLLAHRNFCGYTGFTIDISAFARYGSEPNTIAIRVDATPMEGWWYEGGGLYRHTWLARRDRLHIATDGVFANPIPGASREQDPWSIPVEVRVDNRNDGEASFRVEASLLSPEGEILCTGTTTGTLPRFESGEVHIPLAFRNPRLWSVDTPVLYRVLTRLYQGERLVDEVGTAVGFRHFRFDPQLGFFLNGQPLKIKGVCNHQDHAGVGVAVPDALWEFRLRKLKEMGANAYRCAHNPPSAEFLDACDRLGVLVMDENRLFNNTPEYLRQLEWLVRRDRNHPSVFLWSVFNEEPMQATETGYKMVREMSALVKRLDPTRPVTAAQSSGFSAPVNVSQAVDVVGFNYEIEPYDRFHAANPDKPMLSSEDTSAYMTRGVYETNPDRNEISSYDEHSAAWGATHRKAWLAIASRPYLAGGFVWTGFDYHGEPTPHEWPSTGSFFGCLDQCGFPKAAFYLHQALWLENRSVVKIVPHWTWPGSEGKAIRVMVVSNAPEVSLELNGTPLGNKPVAADRSVEWSVPYAPGTLTARALDKGRTLGSDSITTTGTPTALRLEPDRAALAGDGLDAMPVTVLVTDQQGRAIPVANHPVRFELTGPGRIIGLGNGNPNSHLPEKGDRHQLFNGLAQVIIQSTPNAAGLVRLRAYAEGLQAATLEIPVQTSQNNRHYLAELRPPQSLESWKLSPSFSEKPDAGLKPAANDMNSWAGIKPGTLQTEPAGHWRLYRCEFKAVAAATVKGALITFADLRGKTEAYLDGHPVQLKPGEKPNAFTLQIPPSSVAHTLTLLIQSTGPEPVGLGAPVTLTLP